MSPAIPSPIPHGRTARRLEWAHLPPAVRGEIEQRCGSPVVSRRLAGRRLHARLRLGAHLRGRLAPLREGGVDGRPAAVRRRPTARRRASCGPCPTPSPHRACSGPWTATGWCSAWSTSRRGRRAGPGGTAELTPASTPSRPWPTSSRPLPPGLELDPITDELAAWPAFWDARERDPRPRRTARTRRRWRPASPRSLGGDTLVHTDVRDDNVLLATDGRALFCDWNWPSVGADWLDSLFMLIGPRGDGLDVEAVIAERRLLRDVPAGRRRPRARRHLRLLPPLGRRAGAADLALPPRRPALAGRGGLGLALRAPRLDG